MVNVKTVGSGEVFLIAGGGKTFSDVAAKFCRTEKDVEDLVASPQNKELIRNLISSEHKAALEFDDFIFGIQGYARVTEVQLVRKRHASYMISSGRVDKFGKRQLTHVLPKSIMNFSAKYALNPENITLRFINAEGSTAEVKLNDCFPLMKQQFAQVANPLVIYNFDYMELLNLFESWYTEGVRLELPEEDLRYMRPQSLEFKAAIKMNATALRDWALIRMCNNAQAEIRDLCTKMVGKATEVAPELMAGIGPSCKVYGYCPEMSQCKDRAGLIPTKKQALTYLSLHRDDVLTQEV